MEKKEQKIEKYNINDEVYIVTYDLKIIKCKVIEITKNAQYIKYQLLGEDKNEYINSEQNVFRDIDEANNYIKQCEYNNKINTIESKIVEYQNWVSNLDYALKNYNNCRTIIETYLISNHTNESDKKIFGVTNTGSKQLLEYIRKYYKEQLDIRVKELDEFKEMEYGNKRAED